MLRAQIFISSTSELKATGSQLYAHIRQFAEGFREMGIDFVPWHWEDVQPVTDDTRPDVVVPSEIARSTIFIGLLGAYTGSLVGLRLLFRLRRRDRRSSIPWTEFEAELAKRHHLKSAYYLRSADSDQMSATSKHWWTRQWVKRFNGDAELFQLVDTFLGQCVGKWIDAGTQSTRVLRLFMIMFTLLIGYILAIMALSLFWSLPAEMALKLVGLGGVVGAVGALHLAIAWHRVRG